MGKIVCLMGKSSSGKDTVYKRLLQNKENQLKKIVLYTTRPIRDGEKDGVQYHFVDENTYLSFVNEGKIIEERKYDTCHGVWRYFTVNDGQFDLTSDEKYILIGTIEAYNSLKAYFGDDAVSPVLITVDDGVRLKRALEREMKQDNPKYEEMCRRFLADAEDFSEEKLREAGIERSFNNSDLECCIAQVEEYLRNGH